MRGQRAGAYKGECQFPFCRPPAVGKEAILRLHLLPRFGARRLDEIATEDVQRLKAELTHKSGKTVNKWDYGYSATALSGRQRCSVDLAEDMFGNGGTLARIIDPARRQPRPQALPAVGRTRWGRRKSSGVAARTSQRRPHLRSTGWLGHGSPRSERRDHDPTRGVELWKLFYAPIC